MQILIEVDKPSLSKEVSKTPLPSTTHKSWAANNKLLYLTPAHQDDVLLYNTVPMLIYHYNSSAIVGVGAKNRVHQFRNC
jgi:hypothetical protein